jgi:hypothetical protein
VAGTSVRYVDRWSPDENRALFPDLDDGAVFQSPDVVCNFDEDLLHVFGDETQDFVVCSHVLEHLANPLGFLADIYRVLRPGGVVLILLPDRHRTFDQSRSPTPLAHLVSDYEARVREVDADHIQDFLLKTDANLARIWTEASPEGREALLTLHRKRSIHVHCWDEPEFSSVLCYSVEHLGQMWELVDGVRTDDGGRSSIEFGYVLRRSGGTLTVSQASRRLSDDLEQWRRDGKPPAGQKAESPPAPPCGSPLAEVVRQKDAEIARLRDELGAVYATKLFRYSAPLRQTYARWRRYRATP